MADADLILESLRLLKLMETNQLEGDNIVRTTVLFTEATNRDSLKESHDLFATALKVLRYL
jgi:hypothetical protein